MASKPFLFSISSHSDVIHVNPLAITFLKPAIDFSQYDYIILTSKQATKALTQYDYNEYIEKKALCISRATAKSFEDIRGKVLEIGSGYGNNLYTSIAKYPKETKWLYLRAQDIASDFAEISRKDGYFIDESIVYESSCNSSMKNIEIEEKSILIFTSPSSVKCFLKYHMLKKSNSVVVIGKTTAQSLPSYINPYIADEPSIQGCLDIVKTL